HTRFSRDWSSDVCSSDLESIRFLRKNAGWKNQYPLFSDILFCREEYRIAIENYLEPYMNHYVVQRRDEAVQAIRLLSDSARGRRSEERRVGKECRRRRWR